LPTGRGIFVFLGLPRLAAGCTVFLNFLDDSEQDQGRPSDRYERQEEAPALRVDFSSKTKVLVLLVKPKPHQCKEEDSEEI
jgi:hypothetical protein